MATYITLIDYTDQGARAIKESPQRAQAFIESARNAGVTVRDMFWTTGGHDGALILEGDDETVAGVLLSLATAGNVRTHTLRAYDRANMESILARTS